MAFITSPNMNLTIPGVGTESGPTYATDINSSLTLIDQHNHTTGQGVQVPVAGLNINADLPLGGFNLIGARTLRLNILSSKPSNANDLDCLYVQGVDLYYIDGSANNIRITQSGSVAGSAGTITGLPSGTASASYSSSTFVFQSATSTAANIDGGSFIFRNSTASSYGLTVSAPVLGANSALTLPSVPAGTSFMQLDSSGNMTASIAVSGGLTGSNIASATITGANIDSATITGANIASATITGANIVLATITGAKIAATTITAGNIANATITTTQISASAGITEGQLAVGHLSSGTFQPTGTNAGNVSSISFAFCNYMRVGDIVTMSGQCTIVPSVGAGSTAQATFTLPVSSNFNSIFQASGAVSTTQGTVSPTAGGHIESTSGGTTALIQIVSIGSSADYWFCFCYQVI